MRGLGYYRDPKQDIGGVKGVRGLSDERPLDMGSDAMKRYLPGGLCFVLQG